MISFLRSQRAVLFVLFYTTTCCINLYTILDDAFIFFIFISLNFIIQGSIRHCMFRTFVAFAFSPHPLHRLLLPKGSFIFCYFLNAFCWEHSITLCYLIDLLCSYNIIGGLNLFIGILLWNFTISLWAADSSLPRLKNEALVIRWI